MIVYHRPGAGRPIRIVWMLEEVGAPYELRIMTTEEAAGGEHRARHPLGRVPVVEYDDGALFESTALCLHTADLHPSAGLVPPVGTRDRALVYQWAFYAMTEIEPPAIQAYRLRESAPEVAKSAAKRLDASVAVIEETLQGREYLVGDGFTVADVIASEVVRILVRLDLMEPQGAIAEYLTLMEARPARQRAAAKFA